MNSGAAAAAGVSELQRARGREKATYLWIRVLGVAAIAFVATTSFQARPAPGGGGHALGVAFALIVFCGATIAAMWLTLSRAAVQMAVLILAVASGVRFHLIEADHRKSAFLREAARITGAPVEVHTVRIETAVLEAAPLVTARACAPLPRLLDISAKLLSSGGQCLFLKGANAAAELTHAATKWQMLVDRIPSQTSPGACILRISNLARVRPSP